MWEGTLEEEHPHYQANLGCLGGFLVQVVSELGFEGPKGLFQVGKETGIRLYFRVKVRVGGPQIPFPTPSPDPRQIGGW